MQTVKFTINHLTGKGWKDSSGTITVDETIGTKTGRDEFATARGTIKTIIRNKTICHPGTRARLVIDDKKVINIWLENGKFCND